MLQLFKTGVRKTKIEDRRPKTQKAKTPKKNGIPNSNQGLRFPHIQAGMRKTKTPTKNIMTKRRIGLTQYSLCLLRPTSRFKPITLESSFSTHPGRYAENEDPYKKMQSRTEASQTQHPLFLLWPTSHFRPITPESSQFLVFVFRIPAWMCRKRRPTAVIHER